MLRRLSLIVALAAGAVAPLAMPADAAISDGALGARQALAQTAPVEPAQFFFGGRGFCWYLNGWRGPGWYWCGYAWRSGYGWGGGYGWNGWRHPGWNGGRWRPHDGDWRHRDGGGSNGPHPVPHGGAVPHMGAGPAVRSHGPTGGHSANDRHWPK